MKIDLSWRNNKNSLIGLVLGLIFLVLVRNSDLGIIKLIIFGLIIWFCIKFLPKVEKEVQAIKEEAKK